MATLPSATQSLIVLETDQVTILVILPTARGQTWQGHDSCSTLLTQLMKSWESLAYLQLCSGSPAGRWWKPCSYKLAARWQRSCLMSAVSPSVFSWSMLGHRSSAAFLLPRPEKGIRWPTPCWTHPVRVAAVALKLTDLISISGYAATGRATWRHLSSSLWSWY